MSSGMGRVFRPKYTDRHGERRRSRTWWLDYSIGGDRVRESAKTTLKKEATRLLHQRLAERGRGVNRRDLEKVTFADLEALIVADYAKNARRSTDRMKLSLDHLRAFFGSWRAVDIAEEAIDRYAADRLKDAAPATVNRELACLRRMFNLGRRARMVGRVPDVDMLAEDNVRTGFVEEADFQPLLDALPERLQPLAEVAYCTGWRRGELLSREWRHVDFDAGWLRLDPGETKNREGRNFPLIPRLRKALERQHERKRSVENRTGRIVTPLFFYLNGQQAGQPIRDFRGAWEAAVDKAGCPGLLFHDFRRTAARNLVRAGVPERVAMELLGHRTRSIFDRYAIVDEAMLREGAEKLTRHYEAQAKPERKVVPLDR